MDKIAKDHNFGRCYNLGCPDRSDCAITGFDRTAGIGPFLLVEKNKIVQDKENQFSGDSHALD